MKKIIYLTTAMAPIDFAEVSKTSLIKPNPSGQNFHYKLITALSKIGDVEVISARPINPLSHDQKKYPAKDNGIFHYLKFTNTKLWRRFTLKRNAKKVLRPIIAANNDLVIFVDSLNVLLSDLAIKFGDLYGIPIYGILTDKPSNLSNVSNLYVQKVEKNFPYFDGFLTLTNSLNEYANLSAKPALIFPGLVTTPSKKNPKLINKYGDYFFFGGALYERYGVKNLVEAFRMLPTKNKLLIAGHGELNKYLEEQALLDKRIVFLGTVSEQEYNSYVTSSIGAINPRPLDQWIDLYSIPSKVLSFFNNGALVFSSDHPFLVTHFAKDYISLGEGSTSEIYDALNKFLLSKKDYLAMRLRGQRDVQQLCQIDEVATKLKKFIND